MLLEQRDFVFGQGVAVFRLELAGLREGLLVIGLVCEERGRDLRDFGIGRHLGRGVDLESFVREIGGSLELACETYENAVAKLMRTDELRQRFCCWREVTCWRGIQILSHHAMI